MEKNKPEIRFKGFEEEWFSTILEKCFNERIERSADGELISVTIKQGVVKALDLDRIDNSSSDKSNYKVVEVGDIAYNSMRMWQGACGYSLYKGICSPAYTVVTPTDGNDVVFFYYLFKRNDSLHLFRINSQGLTSDTWNLKYPAFSKLAFAIPKEKEQQKIAKLLTTLDKLIRKLELKLEKLRNIKQSLLRQMFTNVNGGGYATPMIRFKNYNGEWQMTILSDITERVVRKNSNLESSLPLTVSAQNGLIDQGEFFNSRIASKDVSCYYLIRKGEFAYNKSSSDGYPYGAIKRLDRYEKGVLSTLYIVFALNNSMVDSDYIVAFYDTNYWHEEVVKRAAEGARNHGLLNISAEDFFDTYITLPIDKNEQYEVGHYFILLDKIITDNREKLSKIRTMKQSLLQKMFA